MIKEDMFEFAEFTISGEAWDEQKLHVNIPHSMKEMFDGKNFKDMHHFSMALMNAKCAEEAMRFETLRADMYMKNLKNTLKDAN